MQRSIALIIGWLAAALAARAPARAVTALNVKPPSLAVEEHRLANGLHVLFYQDHSVPIVSVEVWYHVGSKDERKGRSGFAHLFEHIMFEGSAHLKGEEHIHFIESIGGEVNANTEFDRTRYYETIPSNYLERILWMESDRMRSLDISEENFRKARQVVIEERRQNTDEPPYGHLFEIVLGKSFTVHPYKSLPIGSIADLNNATLDDVRNFHGVYYVPNNATLVISGDVNPPEALRWIEKYFAPVPQGKPVPRNATPEPPQTEERRTTAYDAKAPLPAVILSYHIPPGKDPDTYALRVAGSILSNGESSRLYKKMVYEKQMALAAGGQAFSLEDPGIFFFFSILQGGQKPEDGEKALQEEVDRLRREPVSEADLVKAKNQFIADLVFGRETSSDHAEAIGHASVILGDWHLVNEELPLFQKVTAEDVQRVANKYFTPQNLTAVYMLPEATKPGTGAGSNPGTGAGSNPGTGAGSIQGEKP